MTFPDANAVRQMSYDIAGMKLHLGRLGHQHAYEALLKAENEVRKAAARMGADIGLSGAPVEPVPAPPKISTKENPMEWFMENDQSCKATVLVRDEDGEYSYPCPCKDFCAKESRE